MSKKSSDPGDGVKKGSKAILKKNKKGEVIGRIEKLDYGGINDASLRDYRKRASNNGDRTFAGSGGIAPRVGGTPFKTSGMASGTSKKRTIKNAVKNVKKTAASPQAKRAARRAYGK
jgi:hypothetical protein